VRQVSSLKSPWAEILVARRVEEVEGEPRCSKLINAEETEMPRSRARSPSNPSDPLPRAVRLHFARQLNRPAKQRQFLAQSGFAGVGAR
jgi:hypothetical protein